MKKNFYSLNQKQKIERYFPPFFIRNDLYLHFKQNLSKGRNIESWLSCLFWIVYFTSLEA